MPTFQLWLSRNRWRLIDGGMVVLLVLIAIVVTTIYITHERNFHWWVDWWYRTITLAELLHIAPNEALQQLQQSLTWERNSLYTLPLIPLVLLFGNDRLVYEIGLALMYLLPFCGVMGAIATRVILAPPRLVFWSTALLTLLIPVNWIPTFLGIPDTGGALFIALATLVYLQDMQLKRWWRIVLIGGLLACAILLRRHFSYGAIALLGAIALHAVWLAWTETKRSLQQICNALLDSSARLGLIVVTLFLVMRLVAWEFTYQALTRDYRSLYASWSLPLSDMVQRYGAFYGWATWAIVLVGLVTGIATGTLLKPGAILLSLSGGISLLIWLVGLRYGNVFYALHVTPVIVLGLAACLFTGYTTLSRHWRSLLLIGLGGYLLSNWAIGLTPVGQFNHPLRCFFTLNMPPLVRTDYEQVVRLVDYLHELAPDGQPIYVAGYQRLQLTASLLRAAEQVADQHYSLPLNLVAVPQIDSQDFYPLQPLMQAQYVVVPTPLQVYGGDPTRVPAVGEWVMPSETDVVNVVLDAFRHNWGLAEDFQQLPVQFQLEGPTIVHIYRRMRPTSLVTAVRSLDRMQQQMHEHPGGQLDWLSLGRAVQKTQVNDNHNGTYRLVSFPGDRILSPIMPSPTDSFFPFNPTFYDNAADFLYVDNVAGPIEVTGWLKLWTPPCRGASLQVMTLDTQGAITDSTDPISTRSDTARFTRSLQATSPGYLLLRVLSQPHRDGMSYCTVDINQLRVSSQ